MEFKAGMEQICNGMNLGKAMDEYIRTCELAGHSPATIRGYKTIRRNSISEIEKIPLEELKVADIQHQLNQRAADHSPKTVSNDYDLIHKVLSVYAPKLILRGVVLPTSKNSAIKKDRVDIPDDDQIQLLLRESR